MGKILFTVVAPFRKSRASNIKRGIDSSHRINFSLRCFTTALVLLCVVFWTGCSSVLYKFGDQYFKTPEEALQRQDQQLNDYLASIAPTKTPVHGTAIVAVPTLDQIKQKGVKTTGNWASVSKKRAEDIINYTATTSLKNYEFMGKAIERRQIFDKVTLVQQTTPEEMKADTCDFLIYFQLTSPEVFQWYLKSKSLAEPIPLLIDSGKPAGVSRTTAWLDNLERIARSAQSK